MLSTGICAGILNFQKTSLVSVTMVLLPGRGREGREIRGDEEVEGRKEKGRNLEIAAAILKRLDGPTKSS